MNEAARTEVRSVSGVIEFWWEKNEEPGRCQKTNTEGDIWKDNWPLARSVHATLRLRCDLSAAAGSEGGAYSFIPEQGLRRTRHVLHQKYISVSKPLVTLSAVGQQRTSARNFFFL